MATLDPSRLVFLDESAALTNLVRCWARSPCGQRAPGARPFGHWQRLTILGALGVNGIAGAMSVEGATSGPVFHACLEKVLLPARRTVRPDAILVMDNLSAHKTRAVRALLDGSGFAYRYLPPYSPDFNPIEPAWAKVKTSRRTAAARTVDALHAAIGTALDTITPSDVRGFFHSVGYPDVPT